MNTQKWSTSNNSTEKEALDVVQGISVYFEDMSDTTDSSYENVISPIGRFGSDFMNSTIAVHDENETKEEDPGRRYRWHMHPEPEIRLLNSGSLSVTTKKATYQLKAGQAIYLGSDVMHLLSPVKGSGCSCYVIKFQPSVLFAGQTEQVKDKFIRDVLKDSRMSQIVLSEGEPWMNQFLEHIDDLVVSHISRKPGCEMLSQAYLYMLWQLLYQRYHELPKQEETPSLAPYTERDTHRIKTAIQFIEKNYAENLTLEEIAGSIPLSRSECCRCFKRELGQTPFEYLLQCRVLSAAKQLTDKPDAMNISQLALACGFNNVSYFNKVFKKYMGCTPGTYRTHQKKTQPNIPGYAFSHSSE